jgi:hypothetical protein
MQEIVKLRRPPFEHQPAPPWVIHDRGRRRVESRAAARVSHDIKAAIGSDFIGYFQGEWSSEDGWKLGVRVSDQKW